MKIIGRQDNFILFSRTSRDKDKVTKQNYLVTVNGFTFLTKRILLAANVISDILHRKLVACIYYAVKLY